MKRLLIAAFCSLGIVGATAVGGRAETITLVEKSLTELLGEGYTTLGSLKETDMSAGTLYSDVYNRAYSGSGKYAYLYQIDNTGAPGKSSAEMFTLGEFYGTIASGEIGYLKGDLPTGFFTGGQLPESDCFVETMSGGLEVSFYYTKRAGFEISPGEQSRVMFIRSDYSPGEIVGSVINHDVGHGPVVGAVPEPAALTLLALAGLTVLVWRSFKRTRFQ